MLDHISIGVKDQARSVAFYQAALAPLGIRKLHEGFGVGFGRDFPRFWVGATPSPVPEDAKSGLHICFTAASRAEVDAFHAAALAAGGRDNGKPGLRPEYHASYYGAFVIDPDGYRIEAVCHKPA